MTCARPTSADGAARKTRRTDGASGGIGEGSAKDSGLRFGALEATKGLHRDKHAVVRAEPTGAPANENVAGISVYALDEAKIKAMGAGIGVDPPEGANPAGMRIDLNFHGWGKRQLWVQFPRRA